MKPSKVSKRPAEKQERDKKMKKLTEEDKEQILGEIENKGFDTWLVEGYAETYFEYKGLGPILKDASEALKKAERAVEKYCGVL